MNPKIFLIAVLAISLAGCGNSASKNKKQAVGSELVAQVQPTTAQIQTTDCASPYRTMSLKSIGQKKDFQLKIAFCDEDIKTGYVLYDGQTETIPIRFYRSETTEEGEDGRPVTRQLFYNEIYHDEINDTYVLTIQGARFYGAYYLRKKDNKKIELEIIDDDL